MAGFAARYYRKKKTQQRILRDADVESSAISDLAFLLLIFFIVTSTFLLRQGIFLSLPSKEAKAKKIEPEKVFEITPTESSYIYEGKPIERQALLEALAVRKQNIDDATLLVKMGQELKYERLVDAISIAKETGLKVQIRNEGK